MSTIKEILHRPPPPVLHHYTTQVGLHGIITKKEIWASHTQYLNDIREFRHALDLAKNELPAMRQNAADEQTGACLEDMQGVLSFEGIIEGVNVCVCSFSDDGGDSLSQCAYGGRSSGFAIGFSGTFLRQASEELFYTSLYLTGRNSIEGDDR